VSIDREPITEEHHMGGTTTPTPDDEKLTLTGALLTAEYVGIGQADSMAAFLLASGWMAAHDARIRAEALREAADDAEALLDCECGHSLDEHNGLGCYARLSYTPLSTCGCALTDDRTHDQLLTLRLRARADPDRGAAVTAPDSEAPDYRELWLSALEAVRILGREVRALRAKLTEAEKR
jgi:hypothetical protein